MLVDSNLDDESKIALVSVGIYIADKRIKEQKELAINYVENLMIKANPDFPKFDRPHVLSLKLNDMSYLLKVVLSGPNEYSIISGHNFSVLKVASKKKTFYNIMWISNLFYVNITENVNNFQVVINEHFKVDIEQVDNFAQPSFLIPLPVITKSYSGEINIILENCLSKFSDILNGFAVPEPFFSSDLNNELNMFFCVIKDPLLPPAQFQNLFKVNEFSLPIDLSNELQQIILHYTSNYSSLLIQFPSKEIMCTINKYLDGISEKATKYNMMIKLRPIMELAEMYSKGIRGNAKKLVENLLEEYRKVEIKFQGEHIIPNHCAPSKPVTVSDVLSHSYLNKKNKLVIYLIEFVEKHFPGLILELKIVIQKLLSSLYSKMYLQVISKLKNALVTGQSMSHEIRKNEIEAVFLKSINQSLNCVSENNLESLIFSNSEMFEIFYEFFYHKLVALRKCSLEVYIRRAYMAYQLHSFRHSELPTGELCVIFQYSGVVQYTNKNINVPYLKRSNSFVSFNNTASSSYCDKKYSLMNCISADRASSIDKDDIINHFNSDFLNDYNFSDVKSWNLKSFDNDADSAISIGCHSLSEMSAVVSDHVDLDSIGDSSVISQNRLSPLLPSLEEAPPFKKTSIWSLDSIMSSKFQKPCNIFSNHSTVNNNEDSIGNFNLGIMIIFHNLEELNRNLRCLSEFIYGSDMSTDSNYLDYALIDPSKTASLSHKIVVNIALNDSELSKKVDTEVAEILHQFCSQNSDYLNDVNISRITFLVNTKDKSLSYFTFRKIVNFEEDLKVRHIDPAVAFQLEIKRLGNFHLERLPVRSNRMYVYLGKYKLNQPMNSEQRIFVRCIIHHNDINDTSISNIDYMAKEAERRLVEVLDVLEIVWSDGRINVTSSNHIFFYFHSMLCLNKMEELETVVQTMILKYGRRLWKLRITEAELKFLVKLNGDPIRIRLWVHNEGGRSLEIFVYREKYLNHINQKILFSWSNSAEGRFHGIPVNCYY